MGITKRRHAIMPQQAHFNYPAESFERIFGFAYALKANLGVRFFYENYQT
jgi:hypothetical protein